MRQTHVPPALFEKETPSEIRIIHIRIRRDPSVPVPKHQKNRINISKTFPGSLSLTLSLFLSLSLSPSLSGKQAEMNLPIGQLSTFLSKAQKKRDKMTVVQRFHLLSSIKIPCRFGVNGCQLNLICIRDKGLQTER